MSTKSLIDHLNDMLAGEVAAVETYELALRWTREPAIQRTLWRLQGDHDERVRVLRAKLHELAARPIDTSGAWGAFATLIQAGADLLGEAAAISALVEGEEHGVRLYEDTLAVCEPVGRDLIVTVLLPAQRRTLEVCRSLKEQVMAA